MTSVRELEVDPITYAYWDKGSSCRGARARVCCTVVWGRFSAPLWYSSSLCVCTSGARVCVTEAESDIEARKLPNWCSHPSPTEAEEEAMTELAVSVRPNVSLSLTGISDKGLL